VKTELREYLEDILGFGEVVTGSREEEKLVEYIVSSLEEYVDSVATQRVPVMSWREKYAAVEVGGSSIKSAVLPYTLSFDCEAPLLYIRDIRDKKWRSAEDKIVLVEFHRRDADFVEDYYVKAVEAGALGLIAFDYFQGVLRRIVVTGVKEYRRGCGEGPPPIPAVAVNREAGVFLIKREGEKVRLYTEAYVRDSHGYNVEASIYGKLEEEVLLTAHHDHWFSGAADNCLGVSLVIVASRHFSEKRLKRTLKLISFTAEESGAPCFSSYYWTWGSRVYTESRDISKIYSVVNTDVLARGRLKLSASGVDYAKFAEEIIGIPAELDTSYMDSYSFSSKGVPSLSLHTLEDYMDYYHTDRDLPENLDWSVVEKGVAAAFRLVEELAVRGSGIDSSAWRTTIRELSVKLNIRLESREIDRRLAKRLTASMVYAYDEHYPDERPAFLKTDVFPELKIIEDFSKLKKARSLIENGDLRSALGLVASIPLRIRLGDGKKMLSINTKPIMIYLEKRRVKEALLILEQLLSLEEKYIGEVRETLQEKLSSIVEE